MKTAAMVILLAALIVAEAYAAAALEKWAGRGVIESIT